MTRQEFEKQCVIATSRNAVKAETIIGGEKYEAMFSPNCEESKEHAINKLFEIYKKVNP